MKSKSKLVNGLICATVGIVICVTAIAVAMHKSNSDKPVEPILEYVETETQETLPESVEYNDDVLESSKAVDGVVFEVGIEDFIDTETFIATIQGLYGSAVVKNYNIGKYGVFYIHLVTPDAEYDGVWDDDTKDWYPTVEEFNATQE